MAKTAALAVRQPEWDDELTAKQAKYVKALADELYDTAREAGIAAGYERGSLDTWIYTALSNPKIQRAREMYLAGQANQATDFRTLGEKAMAATLKEVIATQEPHIAFACANQAAKYGLDKAQTLGEAEQPSATGNAREWVRSSIEKAVHAALRCGLERPEVARRILSRHKQRDTG